MMCQTVEQRRCHFRVTEHAWPFAEGKVGRDDDRGSLVEAADQMEQELAAGLGKGQVAQFYQFDWSHEVVLGEPPGERSTSRRQGRLADYLTRLDFVVLDVQCAARRLTSMQA